MNGLIGILLLAVLLGPSIGQILPPVREVCTEERQDCCGPHGLCDEDCAKCACCAATVITIQSATTAEDLDTPPAPTRASPADTPPSAPPSDILHVPKSV